ncbi:MAG: hypothetical protein HS124_04695 [Anaerolineales bacterium]|nr:hypothetical protein [Anaerolineales bacterium]
MKRLARFALFALTITLLLQSCFRPRVEEEQEERLEDSATIQATYALDDLDACVSGIWKMDVYAIESKFQDLNIAPSMTVIAPSELTIEFRDDNTFGLFGLVAMRMELPSGDYFELDGTHSASGGYQADGRTITFIGTVNDIKYGTMRAYIDGELQEGLFTDEDAPPIAPPVTGFPGAATYECSEATLSLNYTMLSSNVTEMWTRVSP